MLKEKRVEADFPGGPLPRVVNQQRDIECLQLVINRPEVRLPQMLLHPERTDGNPGQAEFSDSPIRFRDSRRDVLKRNQTDGF
jgi:hypothetical protein